MRAVSVAQDSEVCASTIGTNTTLPHSVSETKRFYLNVNKPASCNGTLSSIHYCYYGPPRADRKTDSYQASVAIYRPLDEGSTFRKISNTVTISKMTPTDATLPSEEISFGFSCSVHSLNSVVKVEQGDIIGACIFDPRGKDIKQLDLVAESTSDDGYTMMYQSDKAADCDTNTLPEVVSGLSIDQILKILHVYAEISKSPERNVVCIGCRSM